MEGSRVLQGESLREFRQGIRLVLNNWWAIRLFVKKGWGGPNTSLLIDQLADRVFSWFTQSKRPLNDASLETILRVGVTSRGVMVDAVDNSCAEVAEQLMVMHEECLQGDFSSVKILIEANLSGARAMLQQQDHPSEMEGSRVLQGESMKVFREGIDLVMQSLWTTQVFVERECSGSNSHLLVQQLANLILFWFSQSLKPLSSAYFERILRNEMFTLPIRANAIDSIKEIAEKLMVMHKECLQGNFSSVEILREANLRQAAQPPCVMQQQVFGDKLDGLTRNFEQSFASILSTHRLIYESSTSNEGNNFSTLKTEVPTFKLTLDKGDYSRDSVIEDGNSGAVLHEKIQEQSNIWKEIEENFHMDSVTHGLTLHRQSNQTVCFPPSSSGSVSDNSMINAVEKSVIKQSRSNDPKTLELALTMKKLKFKETQLALNFDLNHLERSKLVMGMSKASFKDEKFKNQLEDLRHDELNKKCIDCLIAGLLVMCSSFLYGAYVYSYERIVESTTSCRASTEESKSWWVPKSVISFDSRLHIFWCQVQAMSRMTFGVLMIFAIAYLLIQRSTTASQTMSVTFILLLLGVACGYCGKLCVDTLVNGLHTHFDPNPSWTGHCTTKNKAEYNSSILDSPILVLCYFARVSTNIVLSDTFC